jgi:hypothetical protein
MGAPLVKPALSEEARCLLVLLAISTRLTKIARVPIAKKRVRLELLSNDFIAPCEADLAPLPIYRLTETGMSYAKHHQLLETTDGE